MIRELLKSAKRFLYLSLKRQFFKILTILDPSFATNFNTSVQFGSGSGSLDSARLRDDSDSSPLKEARKQERASLGITSAAVVNTNDSVATVEVIRFLICGIFEETEQQQFVFDLIRSKLNGSQSIFEVEELISRALENASEEIPLHSQCKQRFQAHRALTASNKVAYTTKDKPRPTAVFWPNPTDEINLRSIYDELPFVIRNPIVNRSTPIGSAGSCFASNIAIALQKDKYNYVVTESNVAKDGSYRFMSPAEAPVSCAAWGTIFNTPSFRQLVEKAFDVRQLPKLLWFEKPKGSGPTYYDPFRENVEFSSVEAFEENYVLHKAATREALLKCKVFVITLGLNEVWYFKADGSVFSRSPWKMAPSLVGHKVMTVDENVADLQRMLDIWRTYNKDIKLIVTLSPIGLHATFRGNKEHVITANAHSKAVLRVAAEEFCNRNKDVYYFPSYEMVNYCTKDPYMDDQRNVRKETVSGVMRLFGEMYVEKE